MKNLNKKTLDELRAKAKDNQLTEEELEAASGGHLVQAYDDALFLNFIFGDNVIPAPKKGYSGDKTIAGNPGRWNTLVTEAWAKGGVQHKCRTGFNENDVSEYFIDGKQVSQQEAQMHVLKQFGDPSKMIDFLRAYRS